MTSSTKKEKRVLYTRCCDGDATYEELHSMYDRNRAITFRTFAKHVDVQPIAEALGYAFDRNARGLRLSKDWAVRFHKSVFKGQPCYYLVWSAIDHIFMHPHQIEELRP